MTSRALNIDDAAKIIDDARRFLNDVEGPEFMAGVMAAFRPMEETASMAGAKLGYGDVLNMYARYNAHRHDAIFSTLLRLADKLKPAQAAGVRFVVAQLFFTYAIAWKYGADTGIKAFHLAAQATEMLAKAEEMVR